MGGIRLRSTAARIFSVTILSSIPGKRDPYIYCLCRLVSCMSVSRATIIVMSSVFDAHHHQTYIDNEYSA